MLTRARVLVEVASLSDVTWQFSTAAELCFTEAELVDLPTRSDPLPSLAARLAAKLAVLELLADRSVHGGPSSLVVPSRPEAVPSRPEEVAALRRVQVLTQGGGAPRLVLPESPAFSEVMGSWVSLSHDAGLGAALVVLERRAP